MIDNAQVEVFVTVAVTLFVIALTVLSIWG